MTPAVAPIRTPPLLGIPRPAKHTAAPVNAASAIGRVVRPSTTSPPNITAGAMSRRHSVGIAEPTAIPTVTPTTQVTSRNRPADM